ncbi:hypothetical protein [Xylophilus ampelinus]|uniref:Lipoprotein n=1 Tax=Xylophilus ampelinus TaxID=54067 RepID=A0A318SQW3_9BURK|nr:hypothetical protein [Xylophilus ampelinus]MCS4508914.1 hypothetical protein [Xylophilus ampelinus]PYE79480.1 hypothetical protein DFQ15_102213 [Xylophilus ampelinus]
MTRRLDNPTLDACLIAGLTLAIALVLGSLGGCIDTGPDELAGMQAQADEAAELQAQYAAQNADAAAATSARPRHPSATKPPRRPHGSVLVAAGR